MSISTYAELQTAIANWMHRADLTARIPEFIQMGEGMLNRRLRTVEMETRATAVLNTTTRFMALPDGFLEMQSLFIQEPATELVYCDTLTLREMVVSETYSAQPSHFTVKEEVEFNCIPDAAYTVELHYFKQYNIATDLTNWLLTNYPELYLHASLSAAALFARDTELLNTSKAVVNEAIEDLNYSESRKRGSHMGYMRVDAAIGGNSGFDITTG